VIELQKKIGLLAGFLLLAGCSLLLLNFILPSPLPEQFPVPCSSRVVDRHGETLRLFTSRDGFWRLPARLPGSAVSVTGSQDTALVVDPQFIRLLLAYEDKRFWSHAGVDPLALGRAVGQFIRHGRVVSRASTITMQTVRLQVSFVVTVHRDIPTAMVLGGEP
jgi:penicillin-binding protein 1C